MRIDQCSIMMFPYSMSITEDYWLYKWSKRFPTATIVPLSVHCTRSNQSDSIIKDLEASKKPIVLIGHGLGSEMMLRAAVNLKKPHNVRLIYIVAYPKKNWINSHFSHFDYPTNLASLGCQVVQIYSTNDPYSTIEDSKESSAWFGSQLVSGGNALHFRECDGYGPWPEGLLLLSQFMKNI